MTDNQTQAPKLGHTVGELIDKLKKFDKDELVFISITGTDESQPKKVISCDIEKVCLTVDLDVRYIEIVGEAGWEYIDREGWHT